MKAKELVQSGDVNVAHRTPDGRAAMQRTSVKKLPSSRRRYTSPAMAERRARIVETAHRILGEGGVAALTIRRLSEEAQVAQRTLYRLFGDKEGVISATVNDRMIEVRDHIARRAVRYTLPAVFEELNWMVTELERDSLYARVVIDFVFSPEPRDPDVRELTSVAEHRFRGWLDLQRAKGCVRSDLNLASIVNTHVMHEFLVYRRWALGLCESDLCRLELHACFLQTAALLLVGEMRETYMRKLVGVHRKIDRVRRTRTTDSEERAQA